MASIDEKDPLQLVDVSERQTLKDLEDQIIDMMLVFDTTCDLIVSLHDKYSQFCRETDADINESIDGEIDTIDVALQEKRDIVISNRKKVETLHTKVKGTIKLVRTQNTPVLSAILISSEGIKSSGS